MFFPIFDVVLIVSYLFFQFSFLFHLNIKQKYNASYNASNTFVKYIICFNFIFLLLVSLVCFLLHYFVLYVFVLMMSLQYTTCTIHFISRGEPGAKGSVGPQGAQGLQGPKGDAGSAGIQGVKGEPGATGTPGWNGVKGDPGEKVLTHCQMFVLS